MQSVANTSITGSASEENIEDTDHEEEGAEPGTSDEENGEFRDDAASDDTEDHDSEGDAFTPQVIKGVYDKSCGNSYKEGVTTLGLSIATHRLWEKSTYEYDRKWLAKNDISDAILDDFTSRMKMEELFPNGALKVNDELYIEVETAQGDTVEKSATVSPLSSSTLL